MRYEAAESLQEGLRTKSKIKTLHLHFIELIDYFNIFLMIDKKK